MRGDPWGRRYQQQRRGRLEIDGRLIDLRQPKTGRKAGLDYVPEAHMRDDGHSGETILKVSQVCIDSLRMPELSKRCHMAPVFR